MFFVIDRVRVRWWMGLARTFIHWNCIYFINWRAFIEENKYKADGLIY